MDDKKPRDDIDDGDDPEGDEDQEEEFNPEKATEKLILACKENNLEEVKFALSKNAIPTEEKDGWSPLLWAACNGNEDIVRELIAHGACTPYLH